MSHVAKRVTGWAIGLAVAAALAFGATVAVATPANATSCPDDGWNFLGEQPSQEACFDACEALHGPHVIERWGPTNHCCQCLF
jgi:hypothetical protein